MKAIFKVAENSEVTHNYRCTADEREVVGSVLCPSAFFKQQTQIFGTI